MVPIHTYMVNGRKYVDLADLELFMRRVKDNNPDITLERFINHIVKEVSGSGQ